jgi:predicted nucleotidyltransferase component of viral defense system
VNPFFFGLSEEERRDALLYASEASGRPALLLEKDVSFVWSLNQLIECSHAGHLVFKGATSLSKAF